MPEAVTHVWRWFWTLTQGRQYTEMGNLPISWSDLQAFFSLSYLNPSPFEVRIIRTFDRAYLNSTAPTPEDPNHE